jgi:hypothetical protein
LSTFFCAKASEPGEKDIFFGAADRSGEPPPRAPEANVRFPKKRTLRCPYHALTLKSPTPIGKVSLRLLADKRSP